MRTVIAAEGTRGEGEGAAEGLRSENGMDAEGAALATMRSRRRRPAARWHRPR